MDGQISWTDDDIKAALIDLDPWALQVTDASNTNPVIVTTASPHGMSDGGLVNIQGVVGNLRANGLHEVVVVGPLELELVGSSGNGDYISGGLAVDMSSPEFLDDIPTISVVATSESLEGARIEGPVAYADPIRFEDVTGPVVRAVVIFKNTNNPTTSRLIGYFDRGTNLPLTPNGFPVQLNWNNQGLFKLSQ